MSETNRTEHRYVKEVTPGITPNSPAFRTILLTSSSMSYSPESVQDDSITGDRQVIESTQVSYEVDGENGARLRYGALDDLFEAAFLSLWAVKPDFVGGAFDAATGTYTVPSGGAAVKAGNLVMVTGYVNAANNGLKKVASATAAAIVIGAGGVTETAPAGGVADIKVVGFEGASAAISTAVAPNRLLGAGLDTIGLVVGEWINIGGTAAANRFTTAGCNGWVRVSAIAAGSLTLDSVPVGFAADAGTAKTIRIWTGDRLRNGATDTALTFERQITGDDNIVRYRYFRGLRLGMNLEIASKQMLTVTFPVMGMSSSRLETARVAGATTLPAVTGEVYDGSNNTKELRLANAPVVNPNIPLSYSVAIDNAYRGRDGVGSQGYVGVKPGTLQVTGGIEAYLGDATLANRLQDQEYFGVAFPTVGRAAQNGYFWDIPRSKLTDGGEEVEGRDADLAPDFEYLGHKTTDGTAYTIQLMRFPYLEQ